MRISLLKSEKSFWLLLLAVIAFFTGCQSKVGRKNDDSGDGEKYGVRQAIYSLDMAILDETKKPMDKVLVEVIDTLEDIHDSLYTDSLGSVGFTYYDRQIGNREIALKIKGPDGKYPEKDTVIIYREDEFKGGSDDGWDWGEAVKTVTMTLERKK